MGAYLRVVNNWTDRSFEEMQNCTGYIYIYINDALSCFNFVIVVKEDTSPNKEDELRYLIKSTLFSSTTCYFTMFIY